MLDWEITRKQALSVITFNSYKLLNITNANAIQAYDTVPSDEASKGGKRKKEKKKPRHASVNKSESAFVDGVKVQAAPPPPPPPRYTTCNAILTRPLVDTKRVIIHLNLPTK